MLSASTSFDVSCLEFEKSMLISDEKIMDGKLRFTVDQDFCFTRKGPVVLYEAFKAKEFGIVADLLKRGVDPTIVIDSKENVSVVDLIFEDLIIYYDQQVFMPVLEALFRNTSSARYLSRISGRTEIPLARYVTLSPGRCEILALIKDRLHVSINELMLLGLASEPFFFKFKELSKGGPPRQSPLAWQMFQNYLIIERIPIAEARKYASLFDKLRDDCFIRKFADIQISHNFVNK